MAGGKQTLAAPIIRQTSQDGRREEKRRGRENRAAKQNKKPKPDACVIKRGHRTRGAACNAMHAAVSQA